MNVPQRPYRPRAWTNEKQSVSFVGQPFYDGNHCYRGPNIRYPRQLQKAGQNVMPSFRPSSAPSYDNLNRYAPPPPPIPPLSPESQQQEAPQVHQSQSQNVVALSLTGGSISNVSWKFDLKDIRHLASLFGQYIHIQFINPSNLYEKPETTNFAPTVLIHFALKESAEKMKQLLKGTDLGKFGKLSVAIFSKSELSGYASELDMVNDNIMPTLFSEAYYSSSSGSHKKLNPPSNGSLSIMPKQQALNAPKHMRSFDNPNNEIQQLPVVQPGQTQYNPNSDGSILDILVKALTGPSGSGVAAALTNALSQNHEIAAIQNVTENLSSDQFLVQAVLQAIQNDPSLITGLQQRLAKNENLISNKLENNETLGSQAPSSIPLIKQPSMNQQNIQKPNNSSSMNLPPAGSNSVERVCRLELIDLFTFYPQLDIPALIVGQDNSNIQYVLEEVDHKVDIELQGIPVNEAQTANRLHVTIHAYDNDAYHMAVDMIEDLLQSVCQQFVDFWLEKQPDIPPPTSVGFRRHEYEKRGDQLNYIGVTERPKPWLNQVASQQKYA